MLKRGPLGIPPKIEVEVVRDHGTGAPGFLQIRQLELKNRYSDGTESGPYAYFLVERSLLDAVTVVLYRLGAEGPEVVLRSQLRPPLAFRQRYEVPILAEGTGAVQWEVPAGLMERGERGEAGLFKRASAEALEEVGIHIPAERFSLLGPATSLSPGLIAEKLHYVYAQVLEDDAHVTARGDGHPVEEHSESVFVPLRDAIAAIESGLVHDIKTEVALRRLASRLEMA